MRLQREEEEGWLRGVECWLEGRNKGREGRNRRPRRGASAASRHGRAAIKRNLPAYNPQTPFPSLSHRATSSPLHMQPTLMPAATAAPPSEQPALPHTAPPKAHSSDPRSFPRGARKRMTSRQRGDLGRSAGGRTGRGGVGWRGAQRGVWGQRRLGSRPVREGRGEEDGRGGRGGNGRRGGGGGWRVEGSAERRVGVGGGRGRGMGVPPHTSSPHCLLDPLTLR
jgi:hypothetical protein